jgi:hypothetical protein
MQLLQLHIAASKIAFLKMRLTRSKFAHRVRQSLIDCNGVLVRVITVVVVSPGTSADVVDSASVVSMVADVVAIDVLSWVLFPWV